MNTISIRTFTLYYSVLDEDKDPIVCEDCDQYMIEEMTLSAVLESTLRRLIEGLYISFDSYRIEDFYYNHCTVNFYGDFEKVLNLNKLIEDGKYWISCLNSVTWKIKIKSFEETFGDNEDIKEPEGL